MNSEWQLSMDDWYILSRCNRNAKQLFSSDRNAADEWALYAYTKWQLEGIPPEEIRARRAPGRGRRLGLRSNRYQLGLW